MGKMLDKILSNKSGMRISRVTPYLSSIIRQELVESKAVALSGVVHKIFMLTLSRYRRLVKENASLRRELNIKKKKLADADAHSCEMAEAVRNLTKRCHDRKVLLRENNIEF